MKKLHCIAAMVALCFLAASALAGGFKPYPGAVLDQRATDDANEMARQAHMAGNTKVFTTGDAFDKVVSYYKGIGKKYAMPGASGKGPRVTFILFDDGKDLTTSRLWAKIQRPALGLYREDVREMKARDLTVIILVQK